VPEGKKQGAEGKDAAKDASGKQPARRRRKPSKPRRQEEPPRGAGETPASGTASQTREPDAKNMVVLRSVQRGNDVKPTVRHVMELKGKRPIVGLTAYDAIMGKLISDAGVDFLLVGDSVGTTLLGFDTTIPVTMEDMVRHTAAVRRSNPQCLLVADLPFAEASMSFDRFLDSSKRLMQEGGADAIKVEGGRDLADDIEKLVATGIPVLGHIGLLPQTVKALGGYRKFGGVREEAESLYTDAISLEEAGCFAIIAEMIEEKVATELASQILPPLIGIGSGPNCDGQILVTQDLLGLTAKGVPSFVKPYANLSQEISKALGKYVKDVRDNKN
jgi:3-methyl-2-oxobutanoate hydroxymethyltransferase